jgi:hypothetical protein
MLYYERIIAAQSQNRTKYLILVLNFVLGLYTRDDLASTHLGHFKFINTVELGYYEEDGTD